ncbi:MAG: FeoB-associated Cys-rich membrane protein [Lachnospiraceae bacterium]|nr:FeoB-associated Cys-rich membrane protein [Lachnospiraceae bacterium]
MEDLIIIAIVVLIITAALVYIIREKKKGTKCIGCPSAGACNVKAAAGNGCSSCGCCSGEKEHTEE